MKIIKITMKTDSVIDIFKKVGTLTKLKLKKKFNNGDPIKELKVSNIGEKTYSVEITTDDDELIDIIKEVL